MLAESTWLSITALVLSIVSACFALLANRESRRKWLFEFWDMVKDHNSIANIRLREDIIRRLPDVVRTARASGKSLREIDPSLHDRVVEWVNRYEAYGTFYEVVASEFPRAFRERFLEMLHNSTTRSFDTISTNLDILFPQLRQYESKDWGGSYKQLYIACRMFRQRHEFDDECGANPT